MKLIVHSTIATALSLALFFWLHPDIAVLQRLGFGGDELPRLTKELLAFTALLCGAFCGSGFRHLIVMRSKGRKSITNFRKFFNDVFRGIDLWIGVFGSILVFAANLKGLQGITIETYLYMAFEKGFLLTILAEQIYKSLVRTELPELQEKEEQSGEPEPPITRVSRS